MNPRLIICSAVVGAIGCATANDGATTPSPENELPQEANQALHGGDSDAATQCRGRWYPILKDKRSPQVPREDVELIDTLVPHHQAAVKMAEMELERGADAEVKAMAEKIKNAQTEEIATLLQIREELTGCTTVTRFPDAHMKHDMAMMMNMSGAELDLMFVADMIPHHAGALAFTHAALPNLTHPELSELARNVIDMQSEEIGELHMKKKELEAASPNGGPSMGAPAPCTTDADCGGAKCIANTSGSFCDVPEMVVHP